MATADKISLKWADDSGEFKRQTSVFRNWISKTGPHVPERNRYHLYVSHACPWAHRTMILRALKGLTQVISVSVVSHMLQEDGWRFVSAEEEPGCIPDTIHNSRFLRELYFRADKDYKGRFTVPLLWDKKLDTAVNNESSEIIRMLNSEFNDFSTNPGLDLYPPSLRSQIDELNEWVYDGFNNGVYKAGFATKQEAYENNCKKVFETMDRIESILGKQKFLVEDTFTEADIRAFTTALRFDPVYVTHFKCNMKMIETSYPNMLRWMRTIYQMPGIAETVNMEHIKKHYFRSHIKINPNQIVGLNIGPDLTKAP